MAIDLSDVARRLASARATAEPIVLAPGAVSAAADGYAVQRHLIRLSGHAVAGWKVSALGESDRRALGVSHALGGALLAPFFHESETELPLAAFIEPYLECEIAFLLGQDLPARSEPYGRAEVEAAVAAALPAFEIADSRISAGATPFTKLADCVNSGGLVTGAPVRSWRDLDLQAVAITLSHDGRAVATGAGAGPLGDPMLALVALANAQPLPAPLAAGNVVITGSCTGMLPVEAGDYIGRFSGLGEISLRFVA